VLSGVSAGVVGLDAELRMNLPNRSASELLGIDLERDLGTRWPRWCRNSRRCWPSAMAARAQPHRRDPHRPAGFRPPHAAGADRRRRWRGQGGYVLTFDDITALLSAQRKAAWSDVARRIAHEIKNPLTPDPAFSAERLKRRYLKQITNDPETFVACTDTIVRQVEDIGRMVDEFSAFARMPQPVIRTEEMAQIAREALILQQNAHHDIVGSRTSGSVPCRMAPATGG
jgi:two-component system nitrogen regulation sensor histidine kinase NtrY